jgi:hypothetical protein
MLCMIGQGAGGGLFACLAGLVAGALIDGDPALLGWGWACAAVPAAVLGVVAGAGVDEDTLPRAARSIVAAVVAAVAAVAALWAALAFAAAGRNLAIATPSAGSPIVTPDATAAPAGKPFDLGGWEPVVAGGWVATAAMVGWQAVPPRWS